MWRRPFGTPRPRYGSGSCRCVIRVRFLVDANLSPRLAVSLTEARHDAVHVTDLGMSRATDLEILEVADRDDGVVVSADTDFGTLLAIGNRGRRPVLLPRLASPR